MDADSRGLDARRRHHGQDRRLNNARFFNLVIAFPLFIVATADAGEQLILPPAEFANRFGWQNGSSGGIARDRILPGALRLT
jgi:hypothetical protein